MKRILIISCFLLFGILVGYATGWKDQKGYDTPFLLNIPGYMIGDVFQALWVRFINYVFPWILRRPQVFILASILFWGSMGTLLTSFVKPKVIAWSVGIYLVIFGGLSIWYFV